MRGISLSIFFGTMLGLSISLLASDDDDDNIIEPEQLVEASTKLESHLSTTLHYLNNVFLNLSSTSETWKPFLEKVQELCEEKINLVKKITESLDNAGIKESANRLLEQALQHEIFIKRTMNFAVTLRNFSEDLEQLDGKDFEKLFLNVVNDNAINKSTSINFIIFVRWLHQDFREGDFFLEEGSGI